eukprot:2241281-Pyramimonas_sp.AAC.1
MGRLQRMFAGRRCESAGPMDRLQRKFARRQKREQERSSQKKKQVIITLSYSCYPLGIVTFGVAGGEIKVHGDEDDDDDEDQYGLKFPKETTTIQLGSFRKP